MIKKNIDISLFKKLLFEAFFEESTVDQFESRIRFVLIYFFLEDGTIRISEPHTSNSGLEQGMIFFSQLKILSEQYIIQGYW